jgi:hypothetical protein
MTSAHQVKLGLSSGEQGVRGLRTKCAEAV